MKAKNTPEIDPSVPVAVAVAIPVTSEAPSGGTSLTDAAFDAATGWVVRGLKRSRVLLRKAALSLTHVAERLGRLATDLAPEVPGPATK